MKSLLATAIVSFSLLTAGCVHGHNVLHPHGMPPGQAKKVVHVHGHGCGHVLLGGAWVADSHGKRIGPPGKAKN